jgi:hypothetical protein
MAEGFQLVMNQGPQPGQSFPLNQDVVTLGRDPSNTIVISDPQVSRQHARIARRGGPLVLEDLGSTNGTFVNGMRLMGAHSLSAGDVIGLGEAVTFTFYGSPVDSTAAMTDQPRAHQPPRQAPYAPPPAPPQPAPYVPPPAYEAAPYEEVPVYEEPEERGSDTRKWLFAGCGCLVLVAIVACLGVFVLDYLKLLPPIFYEPLRWLGLF